MRHRKTSTRLNRTTSHKKALLRNLSKSLILHERIETTLPKAKELQKFIEPLIQTAKEDSLFHKREIHRKLGLHYNALTTKEARRAKAGDESVYNDDRKILKTLSSLAQKYKDRNGGYTRIIKAGSRLGDQARVCIIECV